MATLPADQRHAFSFGFLYRPYPVRTLLLLNIALIAATAVHCLVYNFAEGSEDTLVESVGWAIANLTPWVIAFEVGKRFPDDPERILLTAALRLLVLIAVTLLSSMALEWSFGGTGSDELAFQIIRRLPAAALLAGLFLVRPAIERRDIRREANEVAGPVLVGNLPLLSAQVSWIRAAGNYVECRFDRSSTLCRMTMKEAEHILAPRGFIRIHRSALVNSKVVTQYRPGKLYDEVQLTDGTWLRVGGAYRSGVAAASRSGALRRSRG